MRKQILSSVSQVIEAAKLLQTEEALHFLEDSIDLIVKTFQEGKKLLIAGNGGSLCDAMHFAEELTGQFRKKRKALPAIALSDVGHLSCVANDFGYEKVFARAIEALGNQGDLFLVLSTSGNSENLVQAVEMAQQKQLKSIAFLGKEGGKLKDQCDLQWIVPKFSLSDRIQELHMALIHILIEMVEYRLFYSGRIHDLLSAKK